MKENKHEITHDEKIFIPVYQVDAFSPIPFKGNPAAVCVLKGSLDETTMQQIAAEMNLSETAFVFPLDRNKPIEESNTFSLRWFTPKVEVPLCGHATLATSHVLFYEIGIRTDVIHHQTSSGELIAMKRENGIALNFPSNDPVPIEPQRILLDTMGISTPVEVKYSGTMKMLLIQLGEEREVMELEPDFESMKPAVSEPEIMGVTVTAPGNPPFDFVSRFFAPWLGINEDPVTGAAHTVLTPYWSKHLGKDRMKAYQASERGGELDVRMLSGGRVELTGRAVTIFVGRLIL